MNIADHFGRGQKYFRAADIGDPVVLTISGCEEVEIGVAQERKVVLSFRETAQRLVLNRVNAESISRILGTAETDGWVNRRIELFRDDSVSFNGTQGGVRVRSPSPLHFRQTQPVASPKPPF